MSVRVVVADDHPVFLDGLRLLLESGGDIEVVAAAADGPGLLDSTAGLAFDVAVLDLDMPGMDGVEVASALFRRDPDARVLMLTMHDDAESVRRALSAGAAGYVLKGAGHGAIARAVHSIAEGDTVLGGAVGRTVRTTLAAADPVLALRAEGLSEREREVLGLVATGRSNAQIAGTLYLSVKTVQNHVSNLLGKTGAGSRAALVAWARDRGVPGPGSGPQSG